MLGGGPTIVRIVPFELATSPGPGWRCNYTSRCLDALEETGFPRIFRDMWVDM